MLHKLWLPALAVGLFASLGAGPALGQSFFDGAYGGVGLAQTVVPLYTKDSPANTDVFTRETQNAGVAEGPGGGVLLGYGRRRNQVYFGGEGSFTLATATFNKTTEEGSGENVRVTARSGQALAGRVGFVRTEQALLYGRVGRKWMQFEFDVEPQNGNVGEEMPRLGGWLFGAGVEIPLLEVVNLRGEYTIVRYDGHNVAYGTDDERTRRFIPQEKSIRVGAVYRF